MIIWLNDEEKNFFQFLLRNLQFSIIAVLDSFSKNEIIRPDTFGYCLNSNLQKLIQ